MKVYVVGNREDVAGFGLAGIEPVSAEDLATLDPADAIVIISQSAAESSIRRFGDSNQRIGGSPNPPLFVVLPEP